MLSKSIVGRRRYSMGNDIPCNFLESDSSLALWVLSVF